jgi:hypothetical protein
MINRSPDCAARDIRLLDCRGGGRNKADAQRCKPVRLHLRSKASVLQPRPRQVVD